MSSGPGFFQKFAAKQLAIVRVGMNTYSLSCFRSFQALLQLYLVLLSVWKQRLFDLEPYVSRRYGSQWADKRITIRSSETFKWVLTGVFTLFTEMARHLSFLYSSAESAALTFNSLSLPRPDLPFDRGSAVMLLFNLTLSADNSNMSRASEHWLLHLSWSIALSKYRVDSCASQCASEFKRRHFMYSASLSIFFFIGIFFKMSLLRIKNK